MFKIGQAVRIVDGRAFGESTFPPEQGTCAAYVGRVGVICAVSSHYRSQPPDYWVRFCSGEKILCVLGNVKMLEPVSPLVGEEKIKHAHPDR